jgi:hypothetical protein
MDVIPYFHTLYGSSNSTAVDYSKGTLLDPSDTHEAASIEAFVGVGYLYSFAGAGMNEVEGVGDGVNVDNDAYMAYVAA